MRILVISQYPISPARHGGQKRTAAIVAHYKKHHSVRHVAIFWRGMYKPGHSKGTTNIVIDSSDLLKRARLRPELAEVLLANAFRVELEPVKVLRELIVRHKPHLIHIEQPYLVSTVSDAVKSLSMTSTVILHGSQNVEVALKKDIYRTKLNPSRLNALLEETNKLEHDAITTADMNLAVSNQDAETLGYIHPRSHWVVVPNGTEEVKHGMGRKSVRGNKQIVFVGSAHPPNYQGFESLLQDTSYLIGRATIDIIGGVAAYLRDKYSSSDEFWSGKCIVGSVDDVHLQNRLHAADVILLPIQSGGGSNLKTAEALYARKKVVGTSFSFRGFESYKSFPNIYIAETPGEFREAIIRALNDPYVQYTKSQIRKLDELLWSRSLLRLRSVEVRAQLLYFSKGLRRLLQG